MLPDINTIYDAAMKLPLDQRRQLISRLSSADHPKKTPGALKKYFGMIDSGDPTFANNDRIDADLAREYGDDHAVEN